jgi:hypothetical protein
LYNGKWWGTRMAHRRSLTSLGMTKERAAVYQEWLLNRDVFQSTWTSLKFSRPCRTEFGKWSSHARSLARAMANSAQTPGSGATVKKLKDEASLYEGHGFSRAVKPLCANDFRWGMA